MAFQFVSHESFPEDPYIKELVYFLFDGKYRVAYVRKQAKNGGLFWGGISAAISRDGAKEYFDAFLQDSNFVEKDIKHFLDERKWETKGQEASVITKSKDDDNIPF